MAPVTSESSWFREEIEAVAFRHRLDPNLIEAIVRVESSGLAHAYRFEPGFYQRYLVDNPEYDGGNPRRISASYGLMQIMYPVARELGFDGAPEELFVPLVNLEYGCKKLRELMNWSRDNSSQALAAYNGGKKGNETPPYRNHIYVIKVKTAFERIAEERNS
jgi:soluble lytic murein transglycosylase-like protein